MSTNNQDNAEQKIDFWGLFSISVGGMIGGGIFAILGLAVMLGQGATPLAFLVAGIPALVTAYTYAKLSARYPGSGGTVTFVREAFGRRYTTGAMNVLLLLSYVVLLGVYSVAFGKYGATFFPTESREMWSHIFITGILVVLAFINFYPPSLVVKASNFFNIAKLLILTLFVVVGLFSTQLDWTRLTFDKWVPAAAIVAAGAQIFLNYEGFELTANSAGNVSNPKRTFILANMISVLVVITFYVLIGIVAVGTLDVATVQANTETALAESAKTFMGQAGYVLIVVAAIMATSSAINATLFGNARMIYDVARDGEIPSWYDKKEFYRPIEGLVIITLIAIFVSNFFDINAIATMGSAGFLLLFIAVNAANYKLAMETETPRWVSVLGIVLCVIVLAALLWQIAIDPKQRDQLWVFAGMIGLAFLIEAVYWYFSPNKKRYYPDELPPPPRPSTGRRAAASLPTEGKGQAAGSGHVVSREIHAE